MKHSSVVMQSLKYAKVSCGVSDWLCEFATRFMRQMNLVKFYSSLCYNILLVKLRLRSWYSRVDANVIIGAIPLRRQLAEEFVRRETIGAVISLYNEHGTQLSPSGEEWKRLGVQWIELPFKNFVESPSIENLRKGIEIIELYAGLEKTVYIHCRDGRSRSATLAACYLIKSQNLSVRKALETIRLARPQVWLKEKNLNVIRLYDCLCKIDSI